MVRNAFAAFAILFSSFAFSENLGWLDGSGWVHPETEYRKSRDGFGGWLVVTPDKDWREKWDTPPDTVANFNTADKLRIGDELVVLIFVVNPERDADDFVDVICDITVIRANNTISVDLVDAECLKGRLVGDPNYIRLAAPIIKMVGEPGDPVGWWHVEVALIDRNRATRLDLNASFELTAE